MSRIAIDKKTQRDKLAPRREPYWGAPLARGLFLGFRRTDTGGTWIARQRDDDGKQQYASLGAVDALPYDEAVKLAHAHAKRVSGGVTADDVDTVEAACKAYVRDREREKGEANASNNEGYYRRHVYDTDFGRIKLGKLRTEHIKDWRAAIGPMKDSSKNRVLSCLKAALNFAAHTRYVGAERVIEWSSVKEIKTVSRRDVYLPPDERKTLLALCGDEVEPFFRSLCLLPLRPGAMAQLVVGNLDKHLKKLTVAKDKHHAGRTIPLSGAAFDLLVEHCKDKLPGAPIFTDKHGDAWNRDTWKEHMKKARATGKINRAAVVYSLRHSTITDMLTNGVDSLTVARISGTSIDQIEKTYGHLLGDHGARAMEVLATLAA
jgi:site-specific recombinase XerD